MTRPLCVGVAGLGTVGGGVYRHVHFDPVPGTLSCADFPAAVSPSGAFTMELLISLSATVVGKMLACGSDELRALAIGPSQPHWCAVIFAGQLANGQPFIGPNVDNMIGSLGASHAADGVDFTGGAVCGRGPNGRGVGLLPPEAESLPAAEVPAA